jgi:phosphohistidine phosphatase
MRLYFFRHAIAHDADEQTSDAERALTKVGFANTERAAEALMALGVKPDHLYSSPLVRAVQTAQIIGQALGVPVEERTEVSPGFSIFGVETLTRDLDHDAEVMFVGHEPDFSRTISSLVGGRVVMKKGGLARIDMVSYEPLLGELVWLIAPKVFGARTED